MKKQTLLLVFLTTFVSFAASQTDTTRTFSVTLTDGSVLMGTVLSSTDSALVFQTSSGVRMELKSSVIRELHEIVRTGGHAGSFMRVDPNRTRLFFTSTGHALEKGKGYFSIYEVFFPMLAFGVTDYITLAGGMSLFPGASEQMLYFAPKLRVLHLQQVDVSAGILYLNVERWGLGISYGVATWESDRVALTGGLGWGFVDGEFSTTPVGVVGIEIQASNSVKFMSENWIFPKGGGALISFGLRFFGESLAGDFGMMRPTSASGDGFPFFPWIGFAYNF